MNKEKIFYTLLTLCIILFMIFTYPANYEVPDSNGYIFITIVFTMAAMVLMGIYYWKLHYQKKKEWGWKATSIVLIVLLSVILHFMYTKGNEWLNFNLNFNFKYVKSADKIKIENIKYGKEGVEKVLDTRYILPYSPKDMEVSWVLEPGSFPPPNLITIQSTTNVKFELDSEGIPVFGIDNHFIWHSKWNYILTPGSPGFNFDDFIWDDKVLRGQGIIIIAEGEAAGGKKKSAVCRLVLPDKIPEDKRIVPAEVLECLMVFPKSQWKMFRGEDAIFFVWESTDDAKDRIENFHEVAYLYKSESKNGFNMKYVGPYSINDGYRVTSVTGDPLNIYVAKNRPYNNKMRGEISEFVLDTNHKMTGYYEGVKPEGYIYHGDKRIDSVVYSKNAGIFYVSGNVIGYFAGKEIGNEWFIEAIEFFETPNPQIVLRDNELYIYLSNVRGVVKIKGVDKFKDYFGHFSNVTTYISGSITIDKLKEYLNKPEDEMRHKLRKEIKAEVKADLEKYNKETPGKVKSIDDEIAEKKEAIKKIEKLSKPQSGRPKNH